MADGTVRPDADLEVATHLLVGAFYARHTAGDPFDPTWAADIVDTVWCGIGSR